MLESRGRTIADSLPPSAALLVCGDEDTPGERNIARLLAFLQIPCKALRPRDWHAVEPQQRYAVLISADCMAQAIHDAEDPSAARALPAFTAAKAIYIYGFQCIERSTKLLRLLTGNPQAKVKALSAPGMTVTITDNSPEMCGPMSGMRVPVTLRAPGCVCDVGLVAEGFHSIIRADEGELFFAVARAGLPLYLNAWDSTLDISALSTQYFDIRKFFCEAAPLIFFLKSVFPDVGWSRAETNACLIVDDPPLKRRYGFLDFGEALELMDHHNFSTTIAFIPWNWQRTDPHTLRLFKDRPEKFSLAVHGCDHTASEFAVRSTELLNRKIQISGQRMECLRRTASIKADRVMVFPQGEFAPEVGRALKLNGFMAAVNTEVAPAQLAANETTIADLWSLAIMKYGTFPIFTRRYLDHGIENFAFDALLGKPCLIAAHHDVFRDHAGALIDLIARLNSLHWNLVWRPLGEAISRSFNQRIEDGVSVVHMFAGSLVLENPDISPREVLLLKEEGDAHWVEAVWVNDKPVNFEMEGGYLQARVTMIPRETALVRVVYQNALDKIQLRHASVIDIGVAAKRYLSEFRDNYLSRSDFLYQSANRLKRLMK